MRQWLALFVVPANGKPTNAWLRPGVGGFPGRHEKVGVSSPFQSSSCASLLGCLCSDIAGVDYDAYSEKRKALDCLLNSSDSKRQFRTFARRKILGNFAFNPLVGQLYAQFTGDPKKRSPEERSKILGFEWYTDDSSDTFFIGPNGISYDFPDNELIGDIIDVPVYARRELLRTYSVNKGRKPNVPGIEFSVTDAMSLIEYYYRTLRGDDLTDFNLFGTKPVSLNKASLEILNNGLLAESSRRPKNEFLNQPRPRDAHGRHFSLHSNVLYRENGEEIEGVVLSRDFDQVTLAVKGKGQISVPCHTISVIRSKRRKQFAHSMSLGSPSPKSFDMKESFLSFRLRNKAEVFEKAANGGVTMTDQDGYSVDAVMNSRMDYPMCQLYTPGGESLGIFSDKSGASLDDVAAAHLASTLFTEW